MSPLLYERPEDCCGCGACANACSQDAISFSTNKYGFLYPVIDEKKCIECGKCKKTCDFQKKNEIGQQPLKGFAAKHKDKSINLCSTSGGVFTALSEWVIDKGGVVYGCVLNDDIKAVHRSAEKVEQLSPMRGSKYVQSDTAFVYREIKERLKEGRYVLFTGTPCQVAALKAYLGTTNTEKLISVDIICHGVPNAMTLRKYADLLEKKYHRKIIQVHFRNKRFEWERPVISVDFQDGGEKWWFSTVDVYYHHFLNGNLQRPSCFNCKYACCQRTGDITVGDFWGYKKAGLKMQPNTGISCCLVNSPKGITIFNQLDIETEEVTPDTIIQGNAHLRRPAKKGKEWDTIMGIIQNDGFRQLASSFKKTHKKAFIKAYIKRIILKGNAK